MKITLTEQQVREAVANYVNYLAVLKEPVGPEHVEVLVGPKGDKYWEEGGEVTGATVKVR